MAMASTLASRHVSAPRALVYRALLDARAIATWIVPNGMTSHVHEFDALEGGSFHISLTYDSPSGTGKTTARTDTYHGRFVKLVPNEQVVEAMEFETTDPAMRGEMTATFTLADAGGGTDVRPHTTTSRRACRPRTTKPAEGWHSTNFRHTSRRARASSGRGVPSFRLRLTTVCSGRPAGLPAAESDRQAPDEDMEDRAGIMEGILEELRRLGGSSMERRTKARRAAEVIRGARSYHWVGLYDVTPTEITAIAWTGSDAPAFPSFARTQGISGAAVAARTPVIVQDVRRDERYLTTFGATLSEAVFPVAAPREGHIVGTIDVESDRIDAFTPEDVAFLRGCALALVGLWLSPVSREAAAETDP